MTKHQGGLYVWRVDKPHAVIGLPLIGRHFGYCGMTNSYYWREKQQLEGSVKYGTTPYSWSDLRPKRYKVLPLPAHLLNSKHRIRRRFVKGLETCLIGITCPVYNDTQQPPWNIRKISKAKAAAQRAARDELGGVVVMGKAIIRWSFWLVLLVAVIMIWSANR
jgi:hypothetical protein